jgi:hypothetical protein
MAKGSGRQASDFDMDETGGALSGLLAEEDDLDRRALWRLGTWAAVSVGAVIVALITNQSSIGMRREHIAAADLIRQTQQVQLAAKETQNEARRLASAIETLNGDRDRLYSRVAVLEQGLDSVTGTIARQNPTSPSSSSQASASPASAVASPVASPSPTAPAPSAATSPPLAASPAPAVTASVDPPPAAAKPAPAPVVAPVVATTAAVADKQASAVATPEPGPTMASVGAPKPATAQASGSLMASKSMAPPDPAAGKLIEAATPPKTVTSAPMPEIVAVAPATPEETESDQASMAPEMAVKRTEFGVDVGGANSIPGLRALWRGLFKSRSNAALTTLRPIIVIKENNNGLGMQLRLVAGPIGDAAAAAKICASLTVNDRTCTTAVFEGQRLALNADDQAKMDAKKAETNKADADNADSSKPTPAAAKPAFHKRFAAKHPKEETPKPEPSTWSLVFGKH